MTTRQKLDRSRECRLWIGQIIAPALTVAASTLAIPEVRQTISAKCTEIKQNIERRLKKNEEG